jgi:LysM repeat protein
MDTTHTHRRARKIRRTGRHTTPSQVEKVAEKAGKAAPAMAIAGVLVAAPQAQAAVKVPAKPTAVAERVHTDAKVTRTEPAARTYTVRSGDTLASIAQRFYHNAADWPWLYHVNKAEISNPNLIYPGEVLKVPYDPPANAASYAPKHAKTSTTTLTVSAAPSGTLSCNGLEQLWEDGGGSSGEAFIAAEIAMAESGGNQYATGPFGERGYWQINPVWGSLSTYDPLGNAKAAVTISGDGTNWSPWTTYTSGAYVGQC